MKKYILLVLTVVSLVSLVFPKDVSPVYSIRYDNIDDAITVSNAIGLKMNIDGNKYTGFDTDGDDYRIFIGWGFGKIGFGAADDGTEEFTFGATYKVVGNLLLDLDYILGKTDDNLRLGLQINF